MNTPHVLQTVKIGKITFNSCNYLPASVTEIGYFDVYASQIVQQVVEPLEFADFSKIAIRLGVAVWNKKRRKNPHNLLSHLPTIINIILFGWYTRTRKL